MPQSGFDLAPDGSALNFALRGAVATCGRYCEWNVDHAGWVVTLDRPERHEFSGRTLEEALAWCLVWLMGLESGIVPSGAWGTRYLMALRGW